MDSELPQVRMEFMRAMIDIRSKGKTPGRVYINSGEFFDLIPLEMVEYATPYGIQRFEGKLFGFEVMVYGNTTSKQPMKVEALEDYDNFAYLKWKERFETSD